MKILIVYDSVFGNTKEIAETIGKALKNENVTVLSVKKATVNDFYQSDMILAGSPTRGLKPTPDMVSLLKSLGMNSLKNKKAGSFDTRITAEEINSKLYGFFEKLFGHACETIERILKQKGAEIIVKGEGFFVKGTKGPIKQGELERAAEWAKKNLLL